VDDKKTIEDFITKSVDVSFLTPNVIYEENLIDVKEVGIIGAGTMGGGIAMNFANVGIPVKIVEVSKSILEKGLEKVRGLYQRSADKGRFSQEELEARMGLIQPCAELSELKSCDLIIEAAFEDIDIKKALFKRLDQIANKGAILATNTSGLDIDEIASVTKRPEDVIGLHFFSPANVMKLLEVVQARKTRPAVIKKCMAMAKMVNKIPVLVGVCNGFVGNRILWARTKQAHRLLGEGVMPWDIDRALNNFGFKMGPFQMSDLAGLDLGWSKGKRTQYPIKDALCEAGRRGQKTSKGYYDYDKDRNSLPSKETEKIIREVTGKEMISMSEQDITETLIFPMINEAIKVLDENKAQRPSDIDVIWLFGYGWPKDKGGLIYYADKVGPKYILESLKRIAADDKDLEISDLLAQVVAEKYRLIDIDKGGLIAN
jgi:3-hydroxyacyl-CoA dehydrogenase